MAFYDIIKNKKIDVKKLILKISEEFTLVIIWPHQILGLKGSCYASEVLNKWIKNIKITLVFYFPWKSRYNCRGTDVFSNIFELLLLLYYTSMHLICLPIMIKKSAARVTSCELRDASSDMRVTSSDIQVGSSNPQITSSNPRVRRRTARAGRLKAPVGKLKARFEVKKPRVK